MTMMSNFQLGKATWIIHRYREDDFEIEPGATEPFAGLIEAVSLRFEPGRGTVTGYGNITVPTLEELARLIQEATVG